ncbi:hypothetical protein [Brevundimonas sp. LM2]|nr:hypothetical protein [Brevundimonas sp. LM2]
MSHRTRYPSTRPTARIAAAAPSGAPAAMITLTLSVLVLLLSGAAWMQLT